MRGKKTGQNEGGSVVNDRQALASRSKDGSALTFFIK